MIPTVLTALLQATTVLPPDWGDVRRRTIWVERP